MHAKVHENVVNAMVMCIYKWLTNNICVSSMKLTYSSQDLFLHSESIHIDFKLTTVPTVQELWPLQEGLQEQDWEKLVQNNLELHREMSLQFIKVDVTEDILRI